MTKYTEKVQVHAKMLGERRLLWNGGGWRVIHRRVTQIEDDEDYADVEIGKVIVKHRTYHVWRRTGAGSMWTVDYEAATRYGRLRVTS